MTAATLPLTSATSRRRVWAAAYVIVFVGWIIVINLHRAVLVTPALVVPIGWVTLLGALFGASLPHLTGAVAVKQPQLSARKRIARLTLFAALFGIWYAIIFNAFAWRLEEWAEFANVDTPRELTAFPIRDIGSNKGGPYIDIGGDGEHATFAISRADAVLIGPIGAPHRPWKWCKPLVRQATFDAVRVFYPARIRLSETRRRITIVPCPAAVRYQ